MVGSRIGQQNDQAVAGVGSRIREAREDAGFTRVQLGERAGISYDAVVKLEIGDRSPNLTTLGRIATALSMPVGRLVGG